MKQGPVLEVDLVMHQEKVSVLGLAMAEEGSVHNIYLHLGLRQLPRADGRQQTGAEPAQHGQQHADAFLPPQARRTHTGTAGCGESDSHWASTWQLSSHVVSQGSPGWLRWLA